jgi:hypothetical protein
MAALTIAQLRAAGVNPASTDKHGFPGDVILDYELDGAKRAVAATDTVDFFQIPDLAGMIVKAAAITVVRPGTATGTMDIQIGGADVTGLTAWATDAAAGTKLVKIATAANTVVNAGAASFVRLQQNTVGLGTGKIRVRVFGTMLEAPSATPV